MKKTLITISLAALLITSLILVAGCGGGVSLSDSDIATIRGFGARLDSHDSDIATINSTLNDLDTDTLEKLADLDADELTVLLGLDLATALNDINQLEGWRDEIRDPSKTGSLPDMLARLETLENGQSGTGGNGGGGTTPSGEVTATLDVDTVPFTFPTSATPYSQLLPVKITNGTGDYQQVKFNLTLQCISSDGAADISASPVVAVSVVPMTITLVPADPTICQLIYCTWADPNPILVSPNKEVVVYVSLTAFTTVAPEVWQVTLSGVLATKL